MDEAFVEAFKDPFPEAKEPINQVFHITATFSFAFC